MRGEEEIETKEELMREDLYKTVKGATTWLIARGLCNVILEILADIYIHSIQSISVQTQTVNRNAI